MSALIDCHEIVLGRVSEMQSVQTQNNVEEARLPRYVRSSRYTQKEERPNHKKPPRAVAFVFMTPETRASGGQTMARAVYTKLIEDSRRQGLQHILTDIRGSTLVLLETQNEVAGSRADKRVRLTLPNLDQFKQGNVMTREDGVVIQPMQTGQIGKLIEAIGELRKIKSMLKNVVVI